MDEWAWLLWTHRVFSYREQQVSFSVVLDLSDGPLVALEQDRFLWTTPTLILDQQVALFQRGNNAQGSTMTKQLLTLECLAKQRTRENGKEEKGKAAFHL